MADQLTFDLALPPPSYTREEFVVGNGNREALGWIDRWPDWSAPALALSGPAGAGKTILDDLGGPQRCHRHDRRRLRR